MFDTNKVTYDVVDCGVPIKLEFVPKYYRMNPETEDLLFDGSYLRDGMRVLIAPEEFRTDLDDIENLPSHVMVRALRNNRWSTISHVRFELWDGSRVVEFVSTYDDRTRVKRMVGTGHSWYVKKDSLVATKKKREEVLELVREAMSWEEGYFPHNVTAERVLNNAVDKFMKLF